MQIHGHENLIKELLEFIKEKTLPPFLIFTGPSNVGKNQTALFAAQALLCSENSEDKKPCHHCKDCLKIKNHSHPALLFIEPEGINLKMECLASIRSFIKLQSFFTHRVIIIDQADTMNRSLQNALLKILEEPPANTHFICVTNRFHQLLPTVRSRAVTLRFHPLSLKDLEKIFPDEKPEALKRCRGRAVLWQKDSASYSSAFHFWENLLKGKMIAKDQFIHFKDRKKSQQIARIWQELLRDARLFQQNSNSLIHQDKNKLYEKLSQLPPEVIDEFYQKALVLEEDIASYADCLLCFENFWHTARRQIKQRSDDVVLD